MPYRYLEDIAIADAAFEAWGGTCEELFIAASDATMNVMVENIDDIAPSVSRTFHLESEKVDMLLFRLLEEILYYKDAEKLLLRIKDITIVHKNDLWEIITVAAGEEINPKKHDLIVDIKAVTLHRFKVEETSEGWKAIVVLDI